MWDSHITIKTESEIALMRESARLVAESFQLAESLVAPGVTTSEINAKIDEFIVSHGAWPAFKGYKVGRQTFQFATCMSRNEVVVHGFPDDEPLKEGETISVDIGVEKNGWFGDSAWTYPVGKIDPERAKLLEVTRESLYMGIAQAKAGGRIYDISKAIQDYCQSHGYGVVKDLVGHGVGSHLHEEPQVPNYVPRRIDREYRNIKLEEGMTIAIEPMINMGTWKVKTLRDGWTVVTADGKPSAHFEHTIVVRPWGGEILTKLD
jgi:methionyl aminopeptidase